MTATLNPDRRQIEFAGRAVHIMPQTFKIAAMLFDRPGRLVRVEAMLGELWGNDPNGGPLTARRAVNVQVCLLRAVLRDLGTGYRIDVEYGEGYRLELPAAEPMQVAA